MLLAQGQQPVVYAVGISWVYQPGLVAHRA